MNFLARFRSLVAPRPRSRPGQPDRRLSCESLENRWVLDSVVVFNELMYHPEDSDPRGEWLELRNLLSVDVDLTGWSLRDGIDFRFPTGTAIPADGYLVVAADPSNWTNTPAGAVLGPWDGALNNAGDRVELRNNSDRRMDEIDYDDRDPWPVAADGAGVTLAKRDPYWTSQDVTNWEASFRRGGSPGAANVP